VKVFIISDIEGCAGVIKGAQTGPEGDMTLYQEARKLYTEEINAAVRGAKAAGATEIVAMDCHGAGDGYTFNSLVAEDLDPDCEFVGMHARAGTAEGVMNHTVSGSDFQNLWFNGTLVGETGINAALCGTWGCPVVLVRGDQAACAEGKELLGEGLTTVQVKRGTGVQSARSLVPSRAREAIEAGAKQALSDPNAVRPYDPGKPCEIKVEYKWTGPVSKLRYRPGVEALDPRTIVSRGDDWWTAWRQFFF
jgi:D-amino peptidase